MKLITLEGDALAKHLTAIDPKPVENISTFLRLG
jgi:hypothetical protein